MPNNNNRINFQVGYNVDQASVNAVKKSLQDLQNIKIQDFKGPELDLIQIQRRAKLVLSALQKAFNVNLNTVNVDKFYSELGLVDRNLNTIYNDFAKAGNQGRAAFNGVASALVTTNTQLRESSSLLLSMGTTMMNTVKWGVASSIMNTFTNSVREAFQYVKSLDSALTDIRIVTGDSREQMASFAVEANNAAQALGRSTMDYTKAALTFYQQGLSDEDVKARTESVLKAQNITGAGLEMADYLTAVWNGYKVANEEAELYVDKLAAVADSSASNMSLLAIAMSKVASSANLLGVPVDNLNAQIATIVATTRQAPESVGNALKTIYSRINDIATGADDALISLGNYSSKMAEVGINVLDANGRLRDTGDVIDEIGGKWETLSHEQQIYLARTMAGQRQYNNLLALFENWGKYTDLVNVSLDSQGTTMEKNSRYMESLEAHLEQLGTASLRLKSSMIDSDSFKGLIDFGTKGVLLFANLIESIGGGGNALLGLGSIATQVFSGVISKLISNVIIKSQQNKQIYEDMRAKMALVLNQKTSAAYLDSLNIAYKEYIDNLSLVHKSWTVLSQDERQAQLNRLLRIRTLSEEKKEYNDNIVKVLEYRQALSRPGATRVIETDVKDGLKRINLALLQSGNAVRKFVDNFGSSAQNVSLEYLLRNIKSIQQAFHGADINGSQKLILDILRLRQEGLASGVTFDSLYDRIIQFYEATGKDVLLIPIIDKLKNGLQLTEQELDKLNAKFGQVNKDAQTAFNTQQVVKFVAGIGQVASGINGLVNITKVWKNESLSAGEKLLQTFTGLSMSIGMLYSGFKSIVPVVGTLFSTVMVGTSGATVGTIAQTAATKGLSVALALAGVSAGALMAALWPLFVVGGVIAGIAVTVAAVDHFTMSVKEAELAIDAFNEKQKLITSSNTTLALQTSTLEEIKNLYELLAEKASAISFDSNIDALTDAERSRYNLLKQIIASYNEDTIAGYNSQGLAILKNNTYIEEQILLLKAKRQAEIDSYVESKEFNLAEKGYQRKHQLAKENLLNLPLQKENQDFDDQFINYTNELKDVFQRNQELLGESWNFVQDELLKISEDGIEGLSENLSKLENLKKIATDKNFYEGTVDTITNQIDGLTELLENIANFDFQEAQYKQAVDESAKIPVDIILTRLSSSLYNLQYNKLALTYGLAMISSLVRSYILGVNNGAGFTFDLGDSITAVNQINEELLSTILDSLISESDLNKIRLKRDKLFLSFDFSELSILEYKEKVSNFIQQITVLDENLLAFAKDHPLLYESLIETLFGFDDFSFGLDARQGLMSIKFADLTIKDYDSAKLKIESYFKQNPIKYPYLDMTKNQLKVEGLPSAKEYSLQVQVLILDFLSQDFNLDLLDSTETFIQYLDEAVNKGIALGDAMQIAADKTRNFASVQESFSTFDLLQQASVGELDDLQFSQLSTLLDGLVDKQLVAEETADILKNKWMLGTDVYKQALQEVSNVLLNDFKQALDMDPSSLLTISEQLEGLITNTETLHQALSMGLLTLEDHYNILGRLGSQYDSCSDELELFAAALASGDQELINSTADALALAIQMELTKASSELIAKSMSQLNDLFMTGQINGLQFGEALKEVSDAEMEALGFDVDLYEDWVNILQDLNPLLELNLYLARQMAKANMRISKGMDDLIANFDLWNDALLDFQENGDVSRLVDSWDLIRLTMANLFDSDALTIDMLGPDFIANNMDKILAVKDGVDGAYEELSALMDQQLILNAYGVSDFSQLDQDIQDAYNQIQAVNNDATIEVGAVFSGLDDLLDAFNRIVAGANWTSEQAQAAFAQMGYNVLVEPVDPKMHLDTENTQYYVPPTWTTQEVPYDLGPFGSGNLSIPIVSRGGHYESAGGGVKLTYEPGTYAIKTVTKNGKGFGGNISRGNAKSSAPRGGGGKKGGGGGGGKGKAPTPSTQAKVNTAKIDTKPKTADYNPYLQEEKSFDRQSKILDLLQNKLKKLVNKDRLKNLRQQNKVLAEQKDILQAELDISANEAAENSTADYARRLKQAFKDISFDKDDQIADINKIQAENANVYNAAVKAAADAFEKEKEDYNNFIENTWNKYATKDLQEAHKAEKERWDDRIKDALTAAKEAIKDAELVYKEREDLIKSYNDAWKDDQDRLKEYNELTLQIYDNLILLSKIKVDLSIDVGLFERDWLDFRNKVIKKLDKDDYLGNAKANAKELMSYFDSLQVQKTKEQIESIRRLIDIMRKNGTSLTYGKNIAQAEEDLKHYMDQQMEDLLNIQELADDIMLNYLDALDDAKDKMDDQIDQYERINDLVEHNMKLTLMLYGDKAYDTMEKYYEYQKDNNQNILNNLRSEQLYWQTLLSQLTRGSDAWKQIKENLDNVTDDLNSKLEDMIDNLADQFENKVNGIIARVNNALTGGRGLDYLDEQWDYINNYDDLFLDTFESKTGIDEVERLYQSTIDGLVGSPKSQQALNKLMNDQLKLLRLKDHLTEYDLERAKASLLVEKARLALEEARDNKTKMRLRRDSQGNYTYQYVADELKLGDLQAALADAQANLYNTDKEHYKQNLNNLYDTYKDYILKMRDLTEEYNNTQDEEERKRIQARIDLLKEATNKMMNGLTLDNKYLLQYLNGSFFDGMNVDTSALTMEEQMLIMEQNIPQMQSNIQDLADTITGEGGILPATADMMKDLNLATKQYDSDVQQILNSAGTSLLTVTNVTDALGNSLDKNILQAQSLTGYYTDLINQSVGAITKIQDVLNTTLSALNTLITQDTIDNLAEAYNLAQKLNGVGTIVDDLYLDKNKKTLLKQNKNGVFASDQLIGWNLNTDTSGMSSKLYQDYLNKMSKQDSLAVSSKMLDTISNLDISKLQLQDLKTVVNTIQAITGNINSIANQGIDSMMSNASGYIGNINNVEQLDQNVHIEANFPNVTQHTEIEQAFNNLVNMASMRASGYRD